eukprot:5505351-Alexandrium_andersonii.AAC.1
MRLSRHTVPLLFRCITLASGPWRSSESVPLPRMVRRVTPTPIRCCSGFIGAETPKLSRWATGTS